MGASPQRLTYRDLERLPEDGLKHELIDGEHFVTPLPLVSHQELSRRLVLELNQAARQSGGGRVYSAPTGVLFSERDKVEPDLFLVPKNQVGQLRGRYVRCVPPLIVEILSPSNRGYDEVKKRRLYERCGVTEYWIVDREIEAVKVYHLEAGRYARPVELSAERGEQLATPVIAGLQIDLAELFRDLPPDEE